MPSAIAMPDVQPGVNAIGPEDLPSDGPSRRQSLQSVQSRRESQEQRKELIRNSIEALSERSASPGSGDEATRAADDEVAGFVERSDQ